jgi:uncharacterized protein (TIGR00730 family)
MKRVCVFCGSSTGTRPVFREAAYRMGHAIARRGLGLVYGGGGIGLMRELADAVLAQRGEVIGVIPRGLMTKEVAYDRLTDLRVVDSMHARKALMADLADGFVALPGGFGTLEEFCEVLTWAQLGLHRKPCGLLNVDGYFDRLLAQLDHFVAEGFLSRTNRSLVLTEAEPDGLLDAMMSYQSPVRERWIDKEET